jgi:hypothetical protein
MENGELANSSQVQGDRKNTHYVLPKSFIELLDPIKQGSQRNQREVY